MNPHRIVRGCLVAGSAVLLPAFGCVTTNQLKDFIRTEVAVVGSEIVSSPFVDAFIDLAGPQVTEEVVPSLAP